MVDTHSHSLGFRLGGTITVWDCEVESSRSAWFGLCDTVDDTVGGVSDWNRLALRYKHQVEGARPRGLWGRLYETLYMCLTCFHLPSAAWYHSALYIYLCC